jgi:hypothetical protein
MGKGHSIGKAVTYQMTAEAARLEIEDAEAQRLMDGSGSALNQCDPQHSKMITSKISKIITFADSKNYNIPG